MTGGRKIAVQLMFPGRSLFGFLRERIDLVGPGAGRAPDILVFPAGKGHLDFSAPEHRMPEDLAARVAAGEVVVVFDCSGEGVVHTPDRTDRLHAFLRRSGLPPERCVYVTQDRGYEAAYRAYCREAGWSTPMKVANYDYFIRQFFDRSPAEGEETFQARLEAFELRRPERERRFVSLTFNPRWNKVLFLLWLIDQGLWDQGFVSFGGFDLRGNREVRRGKMARELLRTPGFEDLAERLLGHIERLDSYGQLLLGGVERAESDDMKPLTTDCGLEEHDRSWFTVVPETEISGPIRITEKPFKALTGFHPAIILGNAGSLGLIRALGFRTFQGFFDESYDQEPDPRRRFEMVAGEVGRLCGLEEARLARLEREFAEVLIHNARQGLVELPRAYRERIDPAFLEELVSVLAREPAGA